MIRTRKQQRRGATVVEMAIVLLPFLVLTMGMLDLGVGIFRSHILAQAARHACRRAIVHGEQATALGSWGPTTIDVPATATGVPIVGDAAEGVQPMLVGCDLVQTRIVVEWLNGNNAFEEPVRVTITSPYTPVLLFIFPNGTIDLSASSTMPIAH
jgi:Flp pilus assembly protein TadG